MIVITASIIVLFTSTASSDNGLFHAIVEYGGGAELSVESFTLYGDSNELLYTKSKPVTHTFYIGNTGVVYALNEKQLYFYNHNGEETLLKDLNCANAFGFSPDHELFFASDRDGLFAYSSGGELIYTFTPGRLFASTDKGKIIAIISTDTLFVYEDGKQKFIKQLSTPYIRNLSFSDDQKSIIVELPSGTEVFDSETGERR
ncbi:hypothetical protein AMJ52_00775 [candidate division TA06 bacterium DG_78]|uniref:Anaphase-promoting complex subunit 4 WD40 domain-containing protein n=1 Tax=candidate division TA06 bacterium DG_78 TaxID=1703772 RepID=A0A0S7YHZ3_UNCT6|nr:MAG: hypothetical protein AMJ52_00775 [candidate division TA06 bacterium DG_78]